jgi:formylglycine-generating enzyme required for sulfatase activity
MIFISYRQADTNTFVGRLEDSLVEVFGREMVFRDKTRLEMSSNWSKDLEDKLDESTIVLAVIGPNWAMAAFPESDPDNGGKLRLSDPEDWVRFELTATIEATQVSKRSSPKGTRSSTNTKPKKLIPLLHQLATGPKTSLKAKTWLSTYGLEGLHTPQSSQIRDDDYAADFDKLCDRLSQVSDQYRDLVDAWRTAKQQGKAGKTASFSSDEIARRYRERLIDETQSLSLAGVGYKKRLKLPIDQAYFPLRAVSTPGTPDRPEKTLPHDPGDRRQPVLLEKLFLTAQPSRAVVVLGEPGAGKTTAMRLFAWRVATAQGWPDSKLPDGIRAVFLKLRDLNLDLLQGLENEAGVKAAEGALRQLWTKTILPDGDTQSSRTVEELLGSGPILWIFDGLDEIFLPAQRALVTAAIEEQVRLAPGTPRRDDRFLVTSRVQGYYDPGVEFNDDFFEMEIQKLKFDESCRFIRLWFPEAERVEFPQNPEAVEKARQRGERLIHRLTKLREDDQQRAAERPEQPRLGLLELIEIPLLLNVICAVYDEKENLPTNRVKLYEIALSLMFERKPHERRHYREETAIRALSEVAWWLNGQGHGVLGAYGTIKDLVTQALANWKGQEELDRNADHFLQYIRQEVGLLAWGGASRQEMSFLHRTFQEYLASVHAINNSLAVELAGMADQKQWKEVVALSLRGPRVFKQQFFEAVLRLELPEKNPNLMGYYLQETDERPVAEFNACLEECRRQGAAGDARAVAVMRLAQNAGFATPDQLPALRLWSEETQSPAAKLALTLMGRGQDAVAVGSQVEVQPVQGPTPADEASRAAGTKWIHEGTKLSFVWIPPGSFQMGSKEGEGEARERPAHQVKLTRGFWLGEFPVTNAQYGLFLKARPKGVREPDYWNDRRWNQPQQPVVAVNWLEAMRYCAWASEQLQAHCTLPTEAQWEYACRAGKPGRWCFGDKESELQKYAWFEDNSNGSTQPVGTRDPNAWGLYDMHGNVWEWCYDLYDGEVYRGRAQRVTDPVYGDAAQDGSADARRVLRGGSWLFSAAVCRSAIRFWSRADDRSWDFGFRLALVPGPSRASQ